MATLTIGQASKLTGFSKSTISRACKEHKLSFTREGNTVLIERSELLRLFPVKQAGTPSRDVSQNGKNIAPQHVETSVELAVLRAELAAAQDALVREREAVAREREIGENLTRQLDAMTRLIADSRPQRRFRWPWHKE